jgi:hypothetical protein
MAADSPLEHTKREQRDQRAADARHQSGQTPERDVRPQWNDRRARKEPDDDPIAECRAAHLGRKRELFLYLRAQEHVWVRREPHRHPDSLRTRETLVLERHGKLRPLALGKLRPSGRSSSISAW